MSHGGCIMFRRTFAGWLLVFFRPSPPKKYIISQQILLVDAISFGCPLFASGKYTHPRQPHESRRCEPPEGSQLTWRNRRVLMTEISWCCRNIGKWNFSDQYRGGGEMHDGMFIKPPSRMGGVFEIYALYTYDYVCIYIYIWMIYDIWMYILYCPYSRQRVCRTFYQPISFFLTKPFFSGLAGEKRAGEEEGVGGVSWQSQRATGVAGGIWQVAKCFWMAGVSLEYHLQNMVPQVWPLDEWTIRFAKCMYIIYRVTQPPYPNELLEEGFKIFFF